MSGEKTEEKAMSGGMSEEFGGKFQGVLNSDFFLHGVIS